MPDEFNELVLREKERKISISRVPTATKELFVSLAKDAFCDDWGLTLKFCLDQALEYQRFKELFFENIDFKLDHILLKLDEKQTQAEESKKSEIRMLDGNSKKKEVK